MIEAVGAGVQGLKEGDRVAYPQGPIGAYAELRTMPTAMVVKLPNAISFEQAAAVMLKGLTVQYLFRQTYRLQGNETILFHAAAGGVGLIACGRGAGRAVDRHRKLAQKAALAKKDGAWQTIDYSKENFAERVLALTNGAKVPVVYDGVGKTTWEGSLDCLQPRGLMVSRQRLGCGDRRQYRHPRRKGIAVRYQTDARNARRPAGAARRVLRRVI